MWTKTCELENMPSTESAKTGARCGVAIAGKHTCWRSWARRKSRVTAEHGYARSVLRAAKRDHVLANVTTNEFAMLCATVCQDILYEIVAELITSDFEELATIHTERLRK